MKNDLVVLTLDPGKTNFAWAICSVSKGVIVTGMLINTITSLSNENIDAQVKSFRIEFGKILKLALKHGATKVFFERFLARPGGGMGNVSESLNLMLGVLLSMCRKKIIFRCIMPAVWKGYMLKHYKVEKDDIAYFFGFSGLSKNVKTYPLLQHQFDASGIGFHVLEKETGNTKLKPIFKKSLLELWKKGIKKNPNYFKGAKNVKII